MIYTLFFQPFIYKTAFIYFDKIYTFLEKYYASLLKCFVNEIKLKQISYTKCQSGSESASSVINSDSRTFFSLF